MALATHQKDCTALNNKYSLPFYCLIFALLTTLPVQAKWLTTKGSARIIAQDIETARQHAINEALDMAQQQIPQSQQQAITPDFFEVIEQQQEKDKITVWVKSSFTVAEEQSQCQSSNPSLKKNLLLVHFDSQNTSYQQDETLHNISQGLVNRVHLHLTGNANLTLHAQPQQPITLDENNPTWLSADFLRHIKPQQAQYILHGTIENTSLHSANAHSQKNLYQSLLDTVGLHQEAYRRTFVMTLRLYDAITGKQLASYPLRTTGLWSRSNIETQDLLSDSFWQTQYGNAIDALLAQQATQITQFLQCQAFMARIIQVDPPYIYLNMGSLSGLKQHDTLQLYHKQQIDMAQHSYYKLIDSKTHITITQVQPGFAVGKIDPGAPQHNIQIDDLAIAW